MGWDKMVGANPVVGPVQLDSNFAQLLSKEEENKREGEIENGNIGLCVASYTF